MSKLSFVWGILSKLPFVWGIFWKVFVGVTVAIVAAFYIFSNFTDYERTSADIPGATMSGLIFCYLLHLWLLPAEYLCGDEYEDDYDEEDDDDEPDSAAEEPYADDPTDDT